MCFFVLLGVNGFGQALLAKLWFVHLPVRRSQLVSVSRRQMPRFSENPALAVFVHTSKGDIFSSFWMCFFVLLGVSGFGQALLAKLWFVLFL